MEELKITIQGVPRSKKNSMNIITHPRTGRPMIVQGKAYREYEKDAVEQIKVAHKCYHIDFPCNIKATFYRPTKVRVDLVNLLNALDDILVKAGVIEDDNWKIVVSHDGSRILFDKDNPRTEVEITKERYGA